MKLLTRHPFASRDADVPTIHVSEGTTIIDLFRSQVFRLDDRPALRRRTDAGWEAITWRDYGDRVAEVAAGLVDLGVTAGDRVALLSANRLEWHVADLAIMSIGAVSVPIYFTASAPQTHYVLDHSGARVCFVGGHDQLGKVLEHRDELSALEHIVLFEPDHRLGDHLVATLDTLAEAGRDRLVELEGELEARRRHLAPTDLATLVYTSGTTGPPKGTMITHGNLTWTLDSVMKVVDIGPNDRFLSYLPLSHIAERVVSHLGQIASGGETWFARSVSTVAEDLQDCRPTVFLGVPRVWEKFHDGVRESVAAQPGVAQRAFHELVELGLEHVAEEQGEAPMSQVHKVEHLALDRTLGHRIRHELGLDKARLLVTAAAPVHPSMIRFFHALGLPIIEVYGQTEGCGPTTINPPGRARIGSVGRPIPGAEVQIGDGDEILVRGGNVCAGYYGDAEATGALVDDDGWMHSGDAGRIDADGYLWITGRVKDLIITASGKNIAPAEIETRLEMEPLISHAIVVGEARPYLTALITLEPEAASVWAAERGRLTDLEALATDADLVAEIGRMVDAGNAERSRIEGIKKFRVLPHDLTIADGELTPTLKVKRQAVYDRYTDLVDELYADDAP